MRRFSRGEKFFSISQTDLESLSLFPFTMFTSRSVVIHSRGAFCRKREREKSVPDLKFRERSALSLCLSVSVSSIAYTRESQNVSNYDEKLCVWPPPLKSLLFLRVFRKEIFSQNTRRLAFLSVFRVFLPFFLLLLLLQITRGCGVCTS